MKHFRIAHRLVRRLRVIAPPLIGEQERCYILEILLRKHAAIRDVRIVPEIGSLTVRYDPVALPEQRLLAGEVLIQQGFGLLCDVAQGLVLQQVAAAALAGAKARLPSLRGSIKKTDVFTSGHLGFARRSAVDAG